MSDVLNPVIELFAGDDQLRARLVRKLDEYRWRLSLPALPKGVFEEIPPEVPAGDVDSAYKLLILSRLLRHGEVGFVELMQEIQEVAGDTFNRELFKGAYAVIHEYVADGGVTTVTGGTGLPGVSGPDETLGAFDPGRLPAIPKLDGLTGGTDSDESAAAAPEPDPEAGAEAG